jgi:hypothetical protein
MSRLDTPQKAAHPLISIDTGAFTRKPVTSTLDRIQDDRHTSALGSLHASAGPILRIDIRQVLRLDARYEK